MNFKTSVLAASVALILAGCGSDDSASVANPSEPTDGKEFTGQYVDAAVEGLFYKTSSGATGITDAEGSFNAREGETVTFFIGGVNGIKIGAASARGIITPFEGAGKYNTALNTAILLQTLDKTAGGDGVGMLTIPEGLRSMDDPNYAKLLSNVVLSDKESVTAFLEAYAPTTPVVDEETALAHMLTVLNSTEYTRGDDKPVADFALDSGKIVRNVSTSLTVSEAPDHAERIFIHADKTLTTEEFNETRGMKLMLFKFESDGMAMLAGTNDRTNSSNFNSSFEQIRLDKSGESLVDEKLLWDEVPDFGPIGCADSASGCTSQTLNTLSDRVRNDKNPSDVSDDWQREIQSGFYDPVTGIHTVARKKIKCTTSDESSCDGRTTTYMDFYYATESRNEERYVDFIGNWVETSVCENGEIAKLNFTFDSNGLTTSGTECTGNSGTTSAEPIEQETYKYAELANIDYWWFNQPGRESKATLAELNSGVLFCDDDNYTPGNVCSNQFVIKWEYQPAGKAWDEGILIRYKYDLNGSLNSRQVMQKIKA